ncbi:hypothetical protein ACWGJX_40710 [Streptomyces sp. NPDC054775]
MSQVPVSCCQANGIVRILCSAASSVGDHERKIEAAGTSAVGAQQTVEVSRCAQDLTAS